MAPTNRTRYRNGDPEMRDIICKGAAEGIRQDCRDFYSEIDQHARWHMPADDLGKYEEMVNRCCEAAEKMKQRLEVWKANTEDEPNEAS